MVKIVFVVSEHKDSDSYTKNVGDKVFNQYSDKKMR